MAREQYANGQNMKGHVNLMEVNSHSNVENNESFKFNLLQRGSTKVI